MFGWYRRYRVWKRSAVRGWGVHRAGPYIRFTPMFGFGLPWFPKRGRRRRLRCARHHGLQIVEWRGARWVVTKQLLSKSRVKKEAIFLDRDKKKE